MFQILYGLGTVGPMLKGYVYLQYTFHATHTDVIPVDVYPTKRRSPQSSSHQTPIPPNVDPTNLGLIDCRIFRRVRYFVD